MGKRILILGANSETAKLVKRAKELGIYTIVTDNIPNSYAKKEADKSYDVDGMDINGLVGIVEHENVDGVLVGTADPLIPSYYELCKRLGFNCYVTSEALLAFTNKRNFKRVCEKYGVHGVPEYTVEQLKEGKDVTYPILVKPADGRSGKGMSICYSLNEVDAALKKALQYSRCGDYIIERYMECDDVFMYYTFIDGKYYLSAMPDRFTTKEQKGVDPVVLGAVYPSKYLDLYLEKYHDNMCQIFKHLKIENGVLLIQAFVENGEFYVYDPGFRLQGGAPHILINAVNGIDQQEMLLQYALGNNMSIENFEQKNDCRFEGKVAASQVVLLRAGKIDKIWGIDEIAKEKEIVSVTQRLQEGDEVTLIGTEQQILVRFHIVCETKDRLRFLVEKINRTVHAQDEFGNEMCLSGLNPNWL